MLSEKIREQLLELRERELEEAFNFLGQELRRRKRQQALESISEIAKAAGFNLSELLEGVEQEETRATGATQDHEHLLTRDRAEKLYIHPERPELTWNGKGRHPYWFKDLLREGYSPEQLLKK